MVHSNSSFITSDSNRLISSTSNVPVMVSEKTSFESFPSQKQEMEQSFPGPGRVKYGAGG